MNKYMLYLNSKRCIGCHGCEVHCKTNKRLPEGPILCEISHEPLKMLRGVPRTEFRFRSCYHCEDPHCVQVCPAGAMQKRADGIVFVDQEKCVGCMACVGACPWGVPAAQSVLRQGGQMRLLHGPGGRRAEAGLRYPLHHPCPEVCGPAGVVTSGDSLGCTRR